MPNRVLRASLFHSDSFLSLKDNTDRICYVACLTVADDLGNFYASPAALIRLWRDLGVATYELAAKVAAELADVDLVRWYEVASKRYGHIPRFRQRVRHIKKVCPRPPDTIECKEIKQLVGETSDERPPNARPPPVARPPPDAHAGAPAPAESNRIESNQKRTSINANAEIPQQTVDNFSTPKPQGKIAIEENSQTEKREGNDKTGQQWSNMAYVAATALTVDMPRRQGEADIDWRDRVYLEVHKRQLIAAAAHKH